ncbi:hypothetical protein C3B44_08690 [Corynebacterium yudongzhengii]|uniref:Uncharacterized protein n=1 Tax=Corynebacterium yudongzhengii TaxID=2080740 RepID=A0A2U1T4F5_9CORY|nr:hypothetical protein [Corynebacterium yudongzhengii]AWB82415.1 hypothetical protein C3B44_08690 [Corynebacterium yudongzhengii]PWC00881.1 hypothetical protein DF222_10335 [Corynebacterium yudongzhengii]
MNWLIDAPLWAQMAIALLVLVPLAGVGAAGLLWLLDTLTNHGLALYRRLRGSRADDQPLDS